MNIVIIGGSRGIGKAAARELLQDGNNVLIVGRNPKTLEETCLLYTSPSPRD